MSHRLNAQARANRQLCRLNRAPVLAAELSSICADSNARHTPILTIAMGDVCVNHTFYPLGNPAVRATLAKAVAAFMKTQRPSLTGIQLKAIAYSEMTMSCVGEATGSVEEMTQARNRLKAMLRSRVPSDAEVQSVFNGCWEQLKQLSPTSRYSISDLEGFTAARPEYANETTVNQRVYQAWSHGCGAFPPECVKPQSAKAIWDLISSITNPELTRDGCPMDLNEQETSTLSIDYDTFTKVWNTGNLEFYCGFYDAQAWVEKTATERDVVHALFTCLAHLSKGQNKTNAWISSRFRRVQEHIIGLSDLDAPIVQEFSKMHGGSKLKSEQIFAALAAAYKCLDDTPAASLCWVIEQSVASNITSALIVSDVISKLQFFPLAAIIGKIIPEGEFKALVRLAMHTLINKFGSLAGPTVTVKEYADIAHLALAIYKKNLRGSERSSLIDYAGEYTQYLKLNKNDLEAMASNIQAISAGSAASSVSLVSLIRSLGLANISIGEMDGEATVFEDLGPMQVEESEGMLPAPSEAAPTHALPMEMRRNKRFYKASSVQTILQRLQQKESAQVTAFKSIMGELSTCGIQTSAYFAEILAKKYQLPYTQLGETTIRNLKLWLGDEVDNYIKEHPARKLNAETENRLLIPQDTIYANFPVGILPAAETGRDAD